MATKATSQRAKPKERRNWRPIFLAALETEGTVWAACVTAKINRSTAYRERQRNEQFALDWADVESKVTDTLEREAVRRALEGSDRMLEFLLKARAPDKYRENVKVEHAGTLETREAVQIPNDPDRQHKVAALLASAGALNGSTPN